MSVSESQKAKKKFRNTKRWKSLRHSKNVEQKGVDPITHGKLSKTANLHHIDLREESYQNIENTDNFVLLNKLTHDVLHFVYKYQSKDEGFIDRLMFYVNRMIDINS